MKSKFKLSAIILTGLLIIIGIDLGLTLYLNNGNLTFLQFLRSSDKADSRQREMLIEENLRIIAIGDSIDLVNLEVWRDKFLVVHQIGISPIRYTKENISKSVVNIRPIKSTYNWLVSFDGDETLYAFDNGQSWVNNRNDTTRVNFYYNLSGERKAIGQLKIIPVDKK